MTTRTTRRWFLVAVNACLATALLAFGGTVVADTAPVADAGASSHTAAPVARPAPDRAAIASTHPLAAEAGMEILAKGGNAFDAAVAVAAAIGVADPKGAGLGGGGFFLLHQASDGRDVFVDAREVAPAAATRDMFLDAAGNPVPDLSTRSAKAAGIPGIPAALDHLATSYGRLPLAASLEPAIRLARRGFRNSPAMALENQLAYESEGSAGPVDSEFARVYLVDGKPPPAGYLIRQPDLAKSLEKLARSGAETFYRGSFQYQLVMAVRGLGGLWSLDDLANYLIVEREPIVATYRGLRIVSAPPPSSGGVWLACVLNTLSGYDRAKLDSATWKHLILEAMRRAHRDRAQYLGDPAFTNVPVAMLTSPDYAAGLRASIRPDKVTPSDMLPGYAGDAVEQPHTTHFSILDAEGNRVAATITLNGWYGARLVIPGTGILLNNEMDDFAMKPGAPNMYGLVGASANAIAPGRRPLSSMSPTFVESDRGLLILGSPGGSYIPSMVLLGILARQQGADAAAIAATPRFHHQYLPDATFAEPAAFTAEERADLERRGHTFRPWPEDIGNLQVVTWDYATGAVAAAADPRRAGAGLVR
jgi:gamma-glutamyltranspeptidase/glutathione hydrolase